MLRSVEQTCRCLCQCAKGKFPTGVVIPTRAYQNPNTIIVERRHPVSLVGEDKYPKLKRRHSILKVVEERPVAYKNTIKCILMETVPEIGIKGSLVEVKKRLFRNQLYPGGKAVYASPENLEFYGSKIQELEDIDQELMSVMNELSSCHLRIFMHKTNNWRIKREHIRIAFRMAGVVVSEENIILPDYAVTEFRDFEFMVQAKGKLRTHVRATVYPILTKKVDPPHEFKYPVFGNKPINTETPVEYIEGEPSINPETPVKNIDSESSSSQADL